MWKITQALALVLFALATLAPPAAASAGAPGAPLAAGVASADSEAGTPFAALLDVLRSWWQGLRTTPEDAGTHSLSGSSGHHMDPNGSPESADSEARRAGEPAPGGAESAPEVL